MRFARSLPLLVRNTLINCTVVEESDLLGLNCSHSETDVRHEQRYPVVDHVMACCIWRGGPLMTGIDHVAVDEIGDHSPGGLDVPNPLFFPILSSFALGNENG